MATPQYNAIRYNVAQYNATAFYFLKRLNDSQGTSDVEIGGEQPVRSEAISSVDTIPARSLSRQPLTDSTIPADTLAKQVSNKGLSETIKTRDWFIGDKRPPVNDWL